VVGAEHIDISIVVPTRNRRALLGRLLDRLDRIDDDLRYEVIVVDEASTDDTAAFLAGFRLTRAQLHVIRHDPPQGPSAARNAGLRIARGEFIGWIDDDDLTSPDRLRRQRSLLLGSGAQWAICAKVDIDDDLQVIGHTPCPPAEGFVEGLLAFNTVPAAGQGLLVRTEVVRELGGFDHGLKVVEDWDLCIRLALRGAPAMLDEPLVGYRIGAVSLSTDTAAMEASIRQVLAKHAAERARRNIEPAWADIHDSLLFYDLRLSRLRAARRAVQLLRHRRSPRTLARCLLGLAAPGRQDERSRRTRRERVPARWREQAESWLCTDSSPIESQRTA
jgi:glycosyltransferase involved in cell wall biosynthesis